ncbi:MAG TPA: prenyltransferase/squalene oxidase repeat-containing protein [Pseudonocardiaceae bacterium]|nr:prenyltransferase/squalene oxidase repeat-containing protein [Pseudonocardiaceae bacterium]
MSEISFDFYGAVSPSVYETARLVTLAPWLAGHRQRVRFLLRCQRRDGRWGGLDGYGLVPTLSATEALLTSLRRWQQDCNGQVLGYAEVVSAADRGLRALFGWLSAGARVVLPDTIAAEIVIPALVAQVNAHLDRFGPEPVIGLDNWRGSGRLVLPQGMDDGLLARLGHQVLQGQSLPTKLLHSLETLGPAVRGAPFVHPVHGSVGCSPAATAAWLADPTACRAAVRYLETVQYRGGGPVPGVTPITVFERAWVLAALTGAGIDVTVPRGLTDSLHAAFGDCGVAAGPGLPPDSDDTAAALYALAQLGSPRALDCLFVYQTDEYFSCFPEERTTSISTNAHVLQTCGRYLEHDGPQRWRYHTVMDKLSGWLRERQEADGSWWDKWHASPYYPTARCATALHRYSRSASVSALTRAVTWLLDSQREDGSWGRWCGTHEETAYAVQTLLQTCASRPDSAVEQAAARGCVFLRRSAAGHQHPPLWHDKDLYTPIRVVRAEGLAALHLAYANPHVAAIVDYWAAVESEREATG